MQHLFTSKAKPKKQNRVYDDLGNEPTWWSDRMNMSFVMYNDSAYWYHLTNLDNLFEWFLLNPILYATVLIKAREYANMRIEVRNRNTGQVEDPMKWKTVPSKIYQTFKQPNCLQSQWEFWMQRKIMLEVAGTAFTYGNFTIGMDPSIITLAPKGLWNVWPAFMKFQMTGKYFDATEMSDIVKSFKFEFGNYKKDFQPKEILINNKPNVTPKRNWILGQPTVEPMLRPLSNIDMAYESRNVIMRNRGMRVILSSDKKDASANLTLLAKEKNSVIASIKNYGLLKGQSQFFFSELPLRAVPIDQDVSKLGLFEEISTDAMVVANGFGVPEVLLKTYLKGATFENQEASVRRLYQGTLIPEAEDDIISLNNFMKLEDTDWMILPSFDHVASLQASKAEEATRKREDKKMAVEEYTRGLITREEYREAMGYPKIPKVGEVFSNGTQVEQQAA